VSPTAEQMEDLCRRRFYFHCNDWKNQAGWSTAEAREENGSRREVLLIEVTVLTYNQLQQSTVIFTVSGWKWVARAPTKWHAVTTSTLLSMATAVVSSYLYYTVLCTVVLFTTYWKLRLEIDRRWFPVQ
jgi:hypothetical protein